MTSGSVKALRVALALTAVAAATPSRAAARRDGGVSIVVCALAHPAGQAGAGARAPLWRIGDGRLLAPTRPAMFFSRKGDRCAWPARRPIAG